jgi:hypothetical protein
MDSNVIGDDILIRSDGKERITKQPRGIRYLGGGRHLMTGNSVNVEIPDNANSLKIYAETGDIRAEINNRATQFSPIMVFGGITPEVIENITNMETLALYGTAGDFATVVFYRKDI